jgi:hypothetical protein
MSFSDSAPASAVTADPTYVGRAYFYSTPATTQALLDQGYDRVKVERRKNPGLPYEEISKAATRLFLRADQCNYTFIDPAALPGYQYRPTIVDSAGLLPPIVQTAFVVDAVDTSYESLITVQELKDRYTWGLLDLFSDGAGNPFPDRLWVHYIQYGITKFETKTRLRLRPTKFVEFHDYMQGGDPYEPLMFLLDEYPIISIDRVATNFPGESPVAFPTDAVRFGDREGELYLMPSSTPSSAPSASFFRRGTRFVPQAYKVEYTAGFKLGQCPSNCLDLVGKEAISGPLNIGGDLVGGAAIASQSISLDGLSQSVNTTSSATSAGFGSRLIQYNKELKSDYPGVIDFYRGKRLYVG